MPAELNIEQRRITRVKGVESIIAEDFLAVEVPLEIRLMIQTENGIESKNISVTMRTPGNDRELALGFLFTEGIITSAAQVSNVKHAGKAAFLPPDPNIVEVYLSPGFQPDLAKLERNFYTTSSCGVCGKSSIEAVKTAIHHQPKFHALSINKSFICALPEKLRAAQNVFKSTGGLHASALFDSKTGELLYLKEDVGRHNALDKLIGSLLLDGYTDMENAVLLLSGRASFELLQKAAVANIAVVAAIGAPSSLAVQQAEEFFITLIGFLKADSFNIYTHPNRIAAT